VPVPSIMIGLQVAPDTHAGWVRERSARMFDDGSLEAEARAVLTRGVSREALAASGIGYAEILGVLDGRCNAAEAAAATSARTLRYAKAQRTYFRRDRRIQWLRPDLMSHDELVSEVVRLHAAPAASATA
jgi:tRNA dimethylallyltransferase